MSKELLAEMDMVSAGLAAVPHNWLVAAKSGFAFTALNLVQITSGLVNLSLGAYDA